MTSTLLQQTPTENSEMNKNSIEYLDHLLQNIVPEFPISLIDKCLLEWVKLAAKYLRDEKRKVQYGRKTLSRKRLIHFKMKLLEFILKVLTVTNAVEHGDDEEEAPYLDNDTLQENLDFHMRWFPLDASICPKGIEPVHWHAFLCKVMLAQLAANDEYTSVKDCLRSCYIFKSRSTLKSCFLKVSLDRLVKHLKKEFYF